MSIADIRRQSLTEEISKIDEKAEYITKLKDEAIENLLKQKTSLLSEGGETAVIDEKIKVIKAKHDEVDDIYVQKQTVIHEVKAEESHLVQYLKDIDCQLKVIQEQHEIAMQQLEEKRSFLRKRLKSIEQLDVLIQELQSTVKMQEISHEERMSDLLKKRADLLNRTDLSPEEMSRLLEEMDRQIEESEIQHQISILSIGGQIAELKLNMFENIELLKRKEKELIAQIQMIRERRIHATESQIKDIDKQLEILEGALKEIQNLLEFSGMTSSERFNKLLNFRGLFVTQSGKIRTASGKIYTLIEAKELGLLDGLEEEMMKMQGLELTPSGRIRTADGKIYTRAEAEKLGIFKGFSGLSIASTESTISSSSESSISGITPSDMQYLKSVLGKPLTLALAEITAKHPKDPIHYLAHWLFKYRLNQQLDASQKREMEALLEERQRLANIAMHQRAEEQAKATLIDLLGRVDLEIARREIETELRRIEADAAAMEAENEELESEARDTLGVYNGPTSGQKL